jgi:hypothetical protein
MKRDPSPSARPPMQTGRQLPATDRRTSPEHMPQLDLEKSTAADANLCTWKVR